MTVASLLFPPATWLPAATRWARRLPDPVRRALRWMTFAGRARRCPVCQRSARFFLPAGRLAARSDAMCPWCGSLERHRLVWLYLGREIALLDGRARILHFAPELGMTQALEREPGTAAITTDLEPENVDVAADITALPFPDASFHWVYCSHVLEHVPDDAAAMNEMRRVLGPGGAALVQVPVREGATLEDPTVTRPEDRLAAFGQEDHVRYYGSDAATRLEAAGFRVTTVTARGLCGPEEIRRYGLIPDEPLYRCDRDA